MRFGLDPEGADSADELVRAARQAVDVGFDALLLRESPHRPSALVMAAGLLARVPVLRVVAEVTIGYRHPLHVAEEAAVVDVAGLGRLALLVRPAPGADDRFFEAASLLRTALQARPFRFEGKHWQVPANLPTNEDHEWRHRMTPAPYQPRMELWCAGVSALDAVGHGFGHVADENAPVDQLRRGAATDDPLRGELARGRYDPWDGDVDELVRRIGRGRAEFGQDWSIVRADLEGARVVASRVRPRVQLERLPDELLRCWDS